MVETAIFLYYMNHHCDLDYEYDNNKSVFLNDTQAHDLASPYEVWLQKVEQFRRCPDMHSLEV